MKEYFSTTPIIFPPINKILLTLILNTKSIKMFRHIKIAFLIVGFFSFLTASVAQVRICKLFSDHAVLQRQKPLPVWGWAKPNQSITAELYNQKLTTQADSTGAWKVTFDPLEAGGPYTLTVVSASDKLTVKDILIGEVWLCSGQSNMEFMVSQAKNYLTERKDADYPQIRHFKVEHEVSILPEKELKSGDWKIASSETVGAFTAVGFFFAREVYKKLNIPIGLLHSSWGGSQVESWISKEGMATSDELKDYANNFPASWDDADARLERTTKKKLFDNPDANPTLDDERAYTKPDYDCSTWHTTDPMGQWDWKGIWAWRGNGYMGKSVEVPAEMTNQITTLGLAELYSYNEVYINGKMVFAGILKGNRKILIPAKTWKPGVNKLMIKMNKAIEPEWYGLGLQGSTDDLYLSAGDLKISLAGNDWKLRPSFAEPHSYAHSSNNIGVAIYNSMIAPLVPYAIRGALWYQGESNAGRAYQYRKTFPLMIQDWRAKWQENFPFYFVQLANYGAYQNSNQGSNWAELREAQTLTLQLPATGMAVITDIGNPKDIHPTNKQDVGKRLAAIALKQTYTQDILHSGPMYDSASYEAGKATLTFKYVGKGLEAHDKFGYLKGFEIAGPDKVFYYAKSEIQGDKIIVSHPKVPNPIAVRYAWADSPDDANLFNIDGFPASSFRTDNWEGVTAKVKFE